MGEIRHMSEARRRKKRTSARPAPAKKRRPAVRYFDYSMLAVLVFLVCFGLIMLYSSSSYSALVKHNDSMYFLKRQVLFCGMGFFAMYWISQIDYHIYAKYAEKLYWFSIALLFLVRLTPLGKEVNGAKRWIRLPMNQQLQPAEIVKLAVILLIPIILCQLGNRAHKKDGIVKVIIWGFGAAAGVYFLTSNLSSAIIVAGITVCLLFVVHPKTKPFMVLAGSGLTAAIIAVAVLNRMIQDAGSSGSFRLRRLLVWLQPEQYASGSGYQTLQGLYAIGSGGFFGKGLGNSAQKMIIPEVQNDMILSVICEELGVCGVIIVLVLFGLLLYRLMFIAQNAPDMYGALVASGIFAHPGDFEYSGCDQHNTKYGCYTSVYQLRRHVDPVPDGGNGNCTQYIETDTCGRIVQKHSFQSLYNVLSYIKWFLILHIIEANDEHRRLRGEMK